MKKKLPILIILFIFTICLCGCTLLTTTNETMDNTEISTTNDEIKESEAVNNLTASKARMNNIWGTASSMGLYPAAGRDGFYLPRGTINYYDIDSQTRVKCCSIAGCTHVGSICPANQAGLLAFLECGEYWYIFRKVNSTDIQLSRIVPSTGEQKELFTWEAGEECWLTLNNCIYAYDRIYSTMTITHEDTTIVAIDCYDISQECLINLVRSSDTAEYALVGASNGYVVLMCSEITGNPLNYNAFAKDNSNVTEDDYWDYLANFYREHSVVELRALDIHTKDILLIDGNSEHPPYLFTDPNSCYDNLLIYGAGDEVILCDMNTLSTTTIVTDPGVNNAYLFDNKLFYHTAKENVQLLRCMDLDNGMIVDLEQIEHGEAVTFSIHMETDSTFIGIYQGKHYWIMKNDFYAGRFASAVKYE